jgi:hypothetical protein
MRAFPWGLALAIAALAAPSLADNRDRMARFPADLGWRAYVDPAGGTAVEYPAQLFSVEAGDPERGSGREFRTDDGRARLIVYTLPNQERRSPRSYLDRHLVLAPQALDYSRVTRRFFAISGIRDDDVFYSRCNFPHRRHGDMRCIFLQYPHRETRDWDGIVTRISLSLGEESRVGMALSESRGKGRHYRRR